MSDKWYGLISKWYWKEIEKDGDRLVLKKNKEWPSDEDKTIKVIHVAGGGKMGEKFKDLDKDFKPEVASYLKTLIA